MAISVVITELQEEEKELVRQVLVESYQQYENKYASPEIWEEYLQQIRASIDNPQVDKILVAKSNQDVLGTLQLFESSEKAYGISELQIFSPIIRLLAVHPKARGQGVAQTLLKASIDYAKQKGASSIYLHSSDRMQKAIQLYEWLGFKRDETKEFQKYDTLVKCFRLDL